MTFERDSTASIREYTRLLARRWPLIALVTAVVLGGALAYTFTTEPRYQSSAAILVRAVTPDPLTQSGGSGDVNLETERQLVLSTTVASRAAKAMKYAGTPTDLVKDVSVSVPANTQVLVVEYTALDPRQAQRGAQAFADAYLAYREEKASGAVTSAGSTLQRRLKLLQEQLDAANATIADPGADAQRKRQATASRDFLLAELGVLRAQSATLSLVEVSPGEVIEPARLPERPVSPNLVLNVLGGLFLGLILGVALAVVRDRSVEALGGREGLERLLDRPILGAIPIDTQWRERSRARLTAVEDPTGPGAQAYRALATKLLLISRRRDVKTVMVMSPSPAEGRTTITANLAVAFVESGQRVLVISADTRRPRIHEFFDLFGEVGLLNVLADEVSALDVAQPVSLPRRWEDEEEDSWASLRVLPTGHPVMQSMRGFSADGLGGVLKDVREEFDFILLDSPAALQLADALAAASVVDGVLVVAHGRMTKPEPITWLRQQLDQVDAQILGGVLNWDEGPKWTGQQYSSYDH